MHRLVSNLHITSNLPKVNSHFSTLRSLQVSDSIAEKAEEIKEENLRNYISLHNKMSCLRR